MQLRTRDAVILLVMMIVAGCKKGDGSGLPFQTVGRQPDIAPVMLNKELPFRYPPALYAQKVQGNVTLRIFIDREGAIVPDSTRIAETSGFTALDSAAMKGSRDLKFEPAKTQGQPVPVSILLPVFFRHPDAPPLAGDSIIVRDSSTATASTTAKSTNTAKADTGKASASNTTAKPPVRKATGRKTTR
ncbi:MAG TPA: energy transducer TonB [Gemmatimonadaceae bacterium]|jgi:protein TonB|nr:energy transducer TonB [Gemmatimonadaceae bacterium]